MILLEKSPHDGLLAGYRWRKGDRLLRIGQSEIEDIIDFYYLGENERELQIVIRDAEGNDTVYPMEASKLGELAEAFAPMEFKTCSCRCVFCFIDQNPPGLRPSIYVKDEDYRLSFLYGNYITLTSLGSKGLRRVIEQHLSPLYVSVHATDIDVRTRLLGIRRRIDVLAILRELTAHGIEVHAQIVLCPGWNDGEILTRSLDDLGALYPGVASIAVVPVGLTDHREGLPRLRRVERKDAIEAIERVDRWAERFKSEHGTRLVYLSDEFYLRAGRPLPPIEFYEDLPQEDNGIGQGRALIEEVREALPDLKRASTRPRRATLLTGTLAAALFEDELRPLLDEIDWLELRIEAVENRLYGKGITVAGLLPGRDFQDAIRQLPPDSGRVLLPERPINHEGLFLDDLSLSELIRSAKRAVSVGRGGMVETLYQLADDTFPPEVH